MRCYAVSRDQLLPTLLLLMCLLASACTTSSDDEDPVPPTRSAVLDTIATTRLGQRLTLTASVDRLLETRAFVVRDVDLPPDGLLVLGDRPPGLRAPDLVRVQGMIQLFTFNGLGAAYHLTNAARYSRYERRKVLVADLIRSWA
jgi:hypothetical protein